MSRWGMRIDLDRCTACGACAVACAQENNVPLGQPAKAFQHLVRWLELLPVKRGEYPRADVRVFPMPCQHCDKPPCTKVCPVYATYRSPEGLVPQIYPQCIGCRYCVNACPYTCKYYNWEDPQWPEPMERGLNPDVSIRTRGVTEKCNFCLHRLQKARDAAAIDGKELDPKDYRPACQVICPTEAIFLGDIDDPSGDVASAREDPRAMRLLEELGTEPKITYLKERGP
ncbi:MAG: 4Fe-4S dicluster domain-containing protein [Myxococcales bacterium]|nr:4Fe-4S dicluster domain-containing protein [Myxococcales bacterium]